MSFINSEINLISKFLYKRNKTLLLLESNDSLDDNNTYTTLEL